MSDERQDGFYWVKSEFGSWSIAEKMGGQWGVIAFLDNQCEIEAEINEVGERVKKDATAMDTPKLFEIVATSLGESFVSSYAWCRPEEDARKLFARLNSGYEISEVNEVLAASEDDVIFMPSDCGFGARATTTEKAT